MSRAKLNILYGVVLVIAAFVVVSFSTNMTQQGVAIILSSLGGMSLSYGLRAPRNAPPPTP